MLTKKYLENLSLPKETYPVMVIATHIVEQQFPNLLNYLITSLKSAFLINAVNQFKKLERNFHGDTIMMN